MSGAYPRQSGVLFPLFSCPSSTSWGIGDIGDLRYLAQWLVYYIGRYMFWGPLTHVLMRRVEATPRPTSACVSIHTNGA